MQLYFLLFVMVVTYVCISDPNVLDWIGIKVNHFLVEMQLRYIKIKWMFKKF